MEGRYNMRSPAVKRLMKEAQELREPTEQYFAQPLEDNLFEWHFTIRGPSDSEFEGGIYHGRIILPPDYPMKPPSIMLLTPNGRFEIFKKICLSISGHHPESWQPSWSIRTALLAIIGFMPTHGSGAIGSLDYTPEERKVLAKKSQDWKCQSCGNVNNILKVVTEASEKTKQEAKELASQINFQGEKEKKEESGPVPNSESGASAGAPSDAAPAPEGASSTSTPPPATPPMFPWPMPGMPPFPVPPGGNQQFRFPFPPSPFMIPPEWNQQMPPRYPPFFMHPGFPGAPSPMTGTSQMPSMMSRFPTMKMGLTNTTSSSNRPVMSERQSANKPESQTKNKQSQSSSESKSASNSTSEEPATPSPTATSMPSSSESKTTSSSTSTTSSTSHSQSEGLRQRQTSRPTSTPQQAQVPSPAPVFNQQQDQPSPGGIMSSGLMLVIGLIILLLLVRRLYMMDFLH